MSTAAQKELFEAIHDRYYEATGDQWAEAYKDRFVYRPLLERLAGAKSAIELASGDGAASAWLLNQRPDLDIAGCDISETAVAQYRLLRDRPCYQLDLTKPFVPERTFDAAFVLGGIHHLVADLPTAFDNIARLLNPGGVLVMTEPNSDYMLEPIRQLWYRLDAKNFDAANEHALSHGRLARDFGGIGDGTRFLYGAIGEAQRGETDCTRTVSDRVHRILKALIAVARFDYGIGSGLALLGGQRDSGQRGDQAEAGGEQIVTERVCHGMHL